MPGVRTSYVQDGITITFLDGVRLSETPVADTGIERHYHPNGTVAAEIPRKDGRPHGTIRTWHDNGQLATEREAISGKTIGLERKWGSDGTLEMEINYVLPEAIHGCNYYDEGRRHCAYLFNGTPLSKARWTERVLATGMTQAELDRRLKATSRKRRPGAA
jgi:antitoxin component YwqK of YwqJK toxin-antitoxin module